MSLYSDPIDLHGHTVAGALALYGSDMAWGADIAVTGEADDEKFTTVSGNHGLAAGQPVLLVSKTGGTGITAGVVYFVIAAGLTATVFEVSATAGGSAVNFITDVTAGVFRPMEVASDGLDAESGDIYLAQSAAEVAAQA